MLKAGRQTDRSRDILLLKLLFNKKKWRSSFQFQLFAAVLLEIFLFACYKGNKMKQQKQITLRAPEIGKKERKGKKVNFSVYHLFVLLSFIFAYISIVVNKNNLLWIFFYIALFESFSFKIFIFHALLLQCIRPFCFVMSHKIWISDPFLFRQTFVSGSGR